MKRTLGNIMILLMAIVLCFCKGKVDSVVDHKQGEQFACPMHHQIIQDRPGTCPICGMYLEKINNSMQDGSIMLNESQIKLANITTAVTRLEDMGENTILTGKLVINEDQTRVVSSRTQGRVEKLYVKESGQRVRKDEPLYEIYSEQLLTLQQEYLMAVRQKEEFKNQKYDAFAAAAEKKLILFGMNHQQVERISREKTMSSRITFYSPQSGVISGINISEGQYVEEGSLLFRIENLDELWVEAELYPGESSLVKQGDKVKVQVGGFEADPQVGVVSFISPSYKKGSQITMVRVVLENHEEKFLPGMFATVYVSHDLRKVISLPIEAVIRDEDASHVWILGEDNAFRPRMVITGLENFDKIEILEGINENERVVISGAYLLYGELVLKKDIPLWQVITENY